MFVNNLHGSNSASRLPFEALDTLMDGRLSFIFENSEFLTDPSTVATAYAKICSITFHLQYLTAHNVVMAYSFYTGASRNCQEQHKKTDRP